MIPIKLVFFMSRATPLTRWKAKGMWKRETALYRYLSARLAGLAIVTSGGEDDHALKPAENAAILNNPQKLSPNIYGLIALWQHRKALAKADIYKTNQMDGAWTAVLAGLIFRKPVIVRAGYLWANYELEFKGATLRYRLYHTLSAFSFHYCTHIFLTTKLMKEQVVKNYGISDEKISVIPNYVDTKLFRDLPDVSKVKGRVVFIGRLDAVKNLDLLIEGMALAQSKLHGVFVGSGPLNAELKALAQTYGVEIDFMGNQPNEELPEIINSAEVFALVSRFEGHPKVLIEAMACQVPVLGSRVTGIKEIIEDNNNGRLCDPDPIDIARVLDELIADDIERARLSRNGYAFAKASFGLDNLAELELALYSDIVSGA